MYCVSHDVLGVLHTCARYPKAAGHKAAGPDGWKPHELAGLPIPFFQGVADIWNRMLEGAKLPGKWKHIKTVFIPKPDGARRPLSIAPAMWRACATATLKGAAEWITTWVTKKIVGGIPGKSADIIHNMFEEAFFEAEEGNAIAIALKQDLRKAFDAVGPHMAVHVFEHLGAPKELCIIILEFYEDQMRWLEDNGKCCADPVHCTMSLLQGCPFSPILLGAILTVWVHNVMGPLPQIKGGIYIDDRFLILVNATGDIVKKVIAKAEEVDHALGLIRHPDKNECASNKPDMARTIMEGMEDTTGSPRDHMNLLGITHYCASKETEAHLGEEKKKTIFTRLNRIRYVAKAKHMREKRVKSLVLPIPTWCGAWCHHANEIVKKVRSAVIKTVMRKQVTGARPFLTWTAALGPDLDPVYLMDLRIIGTIKWKIREALEKGVAVSHAAPLWMGRSRKTGPKADQYEVCCTVGPGLRTRRERRDWGRSA